MKTRLHLFATRAPACAGSVSISSARPLEPETQLRHTGGSGRRATVRSLGILPGLFLGLLLFLDTGHHAHAVTPLAIAQFTDVSLGGGQFDYTITLQNTGTTTVGTFWYAWVPAEDFLFTRPTNIVSPAGWTANITGGTPNDGFAIQWVASSVGARLASNGTLNFSFQSPDTPAQLEGNSVYFPSTPVQTSFVYSGGPFSDAGDVFVVQPASIPEPSSYLLLGLGVFAIAGAVGSLKTRQS